MCGLLHEAVWGKVCSPPLPFTAIHQTLSAHDLSIKQNSCSFPTFIKTSGSWMLVQTDPDPGSVSQLRDPLRSPGAENRGGSPSWGGATGLRGPRLIVLTVLSGPTSRRQGHWGVILSGDPVLLFQNHLHMEMASPPWRRVSLNLFLYQKPNAPFLFKNLALLCSVHPFSPAEALPNIFGDCLEQQPACCATQIPLGLGDPGGPLQRCDPRFSLRL